MQIMTKNVKIYIYLIFNHVEIVKLDNCVALSFSYANTVLRCSRCKIHRFVAAPTGNGIYEEKAEEKRDVVIKYFRANQPGISGLISLSAVCL
jgi:hypothetical protein